MKVRFLLNRERRRLRGWILIEEISRALLIFVILTIGLYAINRVFFLFPLLSGVAAPFFQVSVLLAALVGAASFWLRRSLWLQLSYSTVAEALERQSPHLKVHPEHRSELRVAASFLDQSRVEESEAFRSAHLAQISQNISDWNWKIRPQLSLFAVVAALGFLVVTGSQFPHFRNLWLPRVGFVWAPGAHDILLPYPDAQWEKRNASVLAVRNAKIRFEAPASRLQVYVFTNTGAGWRVEPCTDVCEFTLVDSGQYSVGTLIHRSSAFPMQAFSDEPPKSAIFVTIAGESVPGASLQVLNQKEIKLELSASDDLRLVNLRLIHKFGEKEEELKIFRTKEKVFKDSFVLKMEGWKGGQHLIYLEPHDDFQSSRSEPLQILYNDENTLREKRLRELEALINDWTHVLADLLESRADKKMIDGIENRLKEIQYPTADKEGLISAYIKELQLLSDRILRWTDMRGPINRIDDLISRTERSILYGLSLIFQERAGDINQTSQELKNSQADLAKMLDLIKQGKMDLNSEALNEAFKELAKRLEELQNKIESLPQGPNDEMINREALEAQAQEAESLAERIQAIKDQASSGDQKGALKELESLLNQLSILSREMERGLDQWQNNMDQGALQKSQEFAKKIDEIKKNQEALLKKTDAEKQALKKLDESKSIFTQKDLENQEALRKKIEGLEKEQGELSDKLSKAVEEFDRALEGTEWTQLFRSEEAKAIESDAADRMMESEEGLQKFRMMESMTQQKEAIELLDKISNNQKEMQNQVQQMMENPPPQDAQEKVEILGSEGKGERERKRKIMESLKQNVGDKYQKSHERYFEELLQR